MGLKLSSAFCHTSSFLSSDLDWYYPRHNRQCSRATRCKCIHVYLVPDLDLRVETEEATSQTHTQQIAELQQNFVALDNRLGTVEGTLHGDHLISNISKLLVKC